MEQFLEKVIAQMINKFPAFLKPEGSLSCSQQLTVGLWREPDDSSTKR
jgi:hypothetical protein